MTSKIPTILRSTALVLPVAFAIGMWIDGPYLATSALFAGVVTLVNLKFLGWLSTNFIAELAADEDAPGFGADIWGLALATKWVVTVPVFGFLMIYTSPIAVGIGLSTVLLALPIAAAVHDRGEPTQTPAASPMETR